MSQPDTTIEDIKEIVSFAIIDGQNQVHDLRDGRATPEQIEERMFQSLEFHAQALESYINNKVKEARIKELEQLSRAVGNYPDDIGNFNNELLGKWSERKLTHSKIYERIQQLKPTTKETP